jgi:DNA polymerase
MAKCKPPPAPVIEGAPTPEDDSLAALRAAAAACRRCELWEDATQTVFGEGPDDARVLVVGEQPGDEEDLRGRPFVGPAGKLFDKAIAELKLDRSKFYVTNAVKHFRFEMRGSFRLHRSPAPSQQRACHIWLERELAAVKPDIVVCLGAIAARAVFGPKFRLMEQRGLMQRLPDGPRAFATVHPSWVLRQRNPEEREEAWANFLDDLRLLKRRR